VRLDEGLELRSLGRAHLLEPEAMSQLVDHQLDDEGAGPVEDRYGVPADLVPPAGTLTRVRVDAPAVTALDEDVAVPGLLESLGLQAGVGLVEEADVLLDVAGIEDPVDPLVGVPVELASLQGA